jgi:hypothetical protein
MPTCHGSAPRSSSFRAGETMTNFHIVACIAICDKNDVEWLDCDILVVSFALD